MPPYDDEAEGSRGERPRRGTGVSLPAGATSTCATLIVKRASCARWRRLTPFLASGYLKASGYPGEVQRLLKLRGLDAADVQVHELPAIAVGGTQRRAIHFHRFRSRGRERQPDTGGVLLSIVLPEPMAGPLAIGSGSHFGLGLFAPAERNLTGGILAPQDADIGCWARAAARGQCIPEAGGV